MILDYETLKWVWWLLVGILLLGFAVTDGMDMGVGIILRWVGKTDNERRAVINTIGPHWDGNQVWFITAGGAIFAAWPAVYAAAFSGMYFALLLVLFSMFFRPVAFDYRSKLENPQWRNSWDWGLFVGSFVPALVFGVAFGNLLQGVPFHYDKFLMPHYTGGFFGLLNPFALLTGVVSVAMLSMHGAIWLQLRNAQPMAERARQIALYAGIVLLASFAAAGIWLASGIEGFVIESMPAKDALPNPLTKTVVQQSGAWLNNYQTSPITLLAPITGFLGAIAAIFLSRIHRPGLGLISSALSLAGVIFTAGVSLFPFVMPSITDPNSSLTVWDSASSHLTLNVMFIAVVIFLPIILAYTFWTYAKMWRTIGVDEIKQNTHSAY